MTDFFLILKEPWRIIISEKLGVISHCIPDRLYLKCKYRTHTGLKLDIDNPRKFSEKLQWLKLYDRNPAYVQMVDKYKVKEYVTSIIGAQCVIPTLGIWNQFDDIDFDVLPNQFVLKCTHDSGGVYIVRDKSSFDTKSARAFFQKNLNRNFFYSGREWPYKNVKPRIIAEQLLDGKNFDGLIDYKFFCFNGEPRFLDVSRTMFAEGKKAVIMTYMDLNWNKTDFYRPDRSSLNVDGKKPASFDEMINISRKLSKGIPFVRVDLYDIGGKPFFSELTFYPGCGFRLFQPIEWEKKIGDLIVLPGSNK